MAHLIDFSKGKAAVFTVKTPAWHRLGETFKEAPTVDEALVAAGADYRVEKEEAFYQLPDGGYRKIDGFFATVRKDTGDALGVVQGRYNVFQNADGFEIFRPLVDEGFLTLETGGVLRGGADMWILGRINAAALGERAHEVLDGEVQPYAMISNNHTGVSGVVLRNTPIRVVCANTLAASERAGGRAIKILHTSSVKSSVAQAANDLFGKISAQYEAIAESYHLLKTRYLSMEEFERAVLDVVAPVIELKGEREGERSNEGRVEKRMQQRGRLSELWTDGDGHTGNFSAWEAFNAVTQALDHEPLFEVRKNTNRIESMISGGIAEMKSAAMESLLVLAAK